MATTMELRSAADRLIELHEAGDLDGVLDLADEVTRIAHGVDDPDGVVRESLFIARFQRAMALTERQELEAAAQAYEEAASTPSDIDDPDQRHEIAMALLHQGMCLEALDDAEAAADVYQQIVDRFGSAEDPVTRDQVVRARVNRAAAVLNGGDRSTAFDDAQQLITDLDPSAPLDAEQWVMARRIAAAALQGLDRPQDAAAMLAGVGEVDIDDAMVREQQAQAHLDRAQILEELGETGPAAEARAAAGAVGPGI